MSAPLFVLSRPKQLGLVDGARVIGVVPSDLDGIDRVLLYPCGCYIFRKTSGEFFAEAGRDSCQSFSLDVCEQWLTREWHNTECDPQLSRNGGES